MAVGDRAETRMIGPVAMTTASAILGSVPASRQWTTKQFIITNTNGVDALVYIAIGDATVASNRVISALPVAGNDTVVWDTALVLNAGETIRGYSDRNNVNITVVGWVKEV